jgi:type IV secretory pathway VirB10-like protein
MRTGLIFLKTPERRNTIDLSHPYDVVVADVTDKDIHGTPFKFILFSKKSDTRDKLTAVACQISELGITWVFGKTKAEAEAKAAEAKAAPAVAASVAPSRAASKSRSPPREESSAAAPAPTGAKTAPKKKAAPSQPPTAPRRSARLAKGGGRRTRDKGSRRSTRRGQAGRR